MNKGTLIAFSAPSGAGKSTICKHLLNKYDQLVVSISATTRPPRGAEVHGKDYFFYSLEEFKQMIENDELLEYEEVHGNYYGTIKSQVMEQLEKGNSVLFDIDVKGALSIKRMYQEALLLFIKPPSLEELRNRLINRNTESSEEIDKRLSRMELEYRIAEQFDYVVVNDDLNTAIENIEQIISLNK